MSVRLKLIFDRRFRKRVVARYQGHEMEVGILQDKTHYRARPRGKRGFGTLEGGPVRRRSRIPDGRVSDVSEHIRKTQVDFYHRPFRRGGPDLRKFKQAFLKFLGTQKQAGLKKTAVALLQAVVRKPILQKKYGRNSRVTQAIKGFNRRLIDTGQLFKAIKARIVRKRVSQKP